MRNLILNRVFFLLIISFSLFSIGSTETSENRLNESPIYIVYHVGILGNWQEIVKEQLEALTSSGLLEACTEFNVCFVGENSNEIHEIFEKTPYSNKTNLNHASDDITVCEFPSIALVKEIASTHEDAKILYLHSKGVMRVNTFHANPVRAWRLYMEYFVVHHWKECIRVLDVFDACGVDWLTTYGPIPFFAGNFWWARADYIQIIPELSKPYLFKNRHVCENFIGTSLKLPEIKEFHHSNTNLYDHIYSPKEYEASALNMLLGIN